MSSSAVMKWVGRGAIFQLPMIGILALRIDLFRHLGPPTLTSTIGTVLDWGGLIFALAVGARIYYPLVTKTAASKTPQLLTTDVFALTRHPMYHGFFLMDLGHFFNGHLTEPLFWATWLLYLFLTLAAGWHQERETLARWGEEAEAYYARTPRFIFEWIWRR